MAIVIQNLAAFELTLNKDNRRFYFDEDILRNKKIKNIWLFFGDNDNIFNYPSPFTPEVNVFNDGFELSIFLNVVSRNGKALCNNFNCEYFKQRTVDSLYAYQYSRYFNIEINDFIDIEKSFLSIYGDISIDTNKKLLVYVSYENTSVTLTNKAITGSHTVAVSMRPDGQPIRLSDYIFGTLRNRKIKKITFDSFEYTLSPTLAYLQIRCKNNQKIEYLPAVWLTNNTNKEIYFDNLDIDFEESFIVHMNANSIRYLTFYF